jgi:hypothetical protein
VGFRDKEEKNEDEHCIRFLGIGIKTDAIEVPLPHYKHGKATVLVNSPLAQHLVTHRDLETTLGFFSFSSNVVPASCPFHLRLYDALMAISRTHHIPVSPEIKMDLFWWQTFLPQSNGI